MAVTRQNTSSDKVETAAYHDLYDTASSSAESPSSSSSHTVESASIYGDDEASYQGEYGDYLTALASADYSSENDEDQYGSVDDAAQAADAASTWATVDGAFEGSSSGEDAQAQLDEFAENEAAQTDAMSDLGTVKMLGSGFFDKAGAVIDALVPNEGDMGKLKLTVNVPVDPTNTVKVGFAFEALVSRVGGQTKMKVQAAANVSASKKIEAYFFTVEAFARASLAGIIEASGDDGPEAFHLIGLAIHEQIADVSKTVADAVFSSSFIQETIDDMDEDDYVDLALTGSLAAGLGGDVMDNLGAKAQAATYAKVKKRLSKGEDGELKKETSTTVSNSVSVALTASADPFSVTGTLAGKWNGTTFDKLSATLIGQASLDVSEMSDLVKGGVWIEGLITNLAKMVNGTSGMLSGDPARQAGSMAKFIASSSNMEAGLEGMTASALDQWDYFKGLTLKYKLSVYANYGVNGADMTVKMDRISTLSLGSSDDDALIGILLENTQNLFKWST
jgi:hypothetical protein